jgi:DNA-binding transcriptional MerR regulator
MPGPADPLRFHPAVVQRVIHRPVSAPVLGFLRSLDEVKLLVPQRSPGGHRRYSRYQLRLAARVRALVDHGTALDAACRIVILEDQLDEARRINAELNQRQPSG